MDNKKSLLDKVFTHIHNNNNNNNNNNKTNTVLSNSFFANRYC
jgi:hypothetical protein